MTSRPRRDLLGAVALTLLLLAVAAPAAVARDIYVANLGDDSVSVIDSQTAHREKVIDVGEGVEGPAGIAISPDGRTAYVAGVFSDSIQAIDTATRQPAGPSIPIGLRPEAIAVSPDGATVYVADEGAAEVSVVDTRSGSVSSIPVGESPRGIAVSPDGGTVYVSDEGDDDVAVIDAATERVVRRIEVGRQPEAIAVAPDGETLYVADWGGDEVSVVDTRTEEVTSIPVGHWPMGIALSPDGETLYVADWGGDEVSVVDTRTEEVTSIPVGEKPAGIAVSPDGRTVYVADEGDGDVSVIDAVTKSVTGSPIPSGAAPQALAIVPDQPPIAALAPASGTAGTPLAFDASASTDPDGTIAAFDWGFGDGRSALDAGPTPRHTYSTAGTYRATVTLTDDEGCSTEFVFTGQTASCNGSAVAERTIGVPVVAKKPPESPPAPPPVTLPPTNEFQIRRLHHNLRNGTVRMRLRLPGAGSVRLRGPRVRPVWRRVGRAQGLTLVVRPRRMLNVALKRGRRHVRVRVRVTFAPRGGVARTRTKSLTLRRRAAGPGVRRVHASRVHGRER